MAYESPGTTELIKFEFVYNIMFAYIVEIYNKAPSKEIATTSRTLAPENWNILHGAEAYMLRHDNFLPRRKIQIVRIRFEFRKIFI